MIVINRHCSIVSIKKKIFIIGLLMVAGCQKTDNYNKELVLGGEGNKDCSVGLIDNYDCYNAPLKTNEKFGKIFNLKKIKNNSVDLHRFIQGPEDARLLGVLKSEINGKSFVFGVIVSNSLNYEGGGGMVQVVKLIGGKNINNLTESLDISQIFLEDSDGNLISNFESEQYFYEIQNLCRVESEISATLTVKRVTLCNNKIIKEENIVFDPIDGVFDFDS